MKYMTNDETAILTITYEQFVEVLRQWDGYTQVEFSEMARNFPMYFGREAGWIVFGDGDLPPF
jgi:hypothetical protein